MEPLGNKHLADGIVGTGGGGFGGAFCRKVFDVALLWRVKKGESSYIIDE